MAEPRRRLGLVEQSLLADADVAAGPHRLQRHGSPELTVERLVHDAEPAAPDLATQLEPADGDAGRERGVPTRSFGCGGELAEQRTEPAGKALSARWGGIRAARVLRHPRPPRLEA